MDEFAQSRPADGLFDDDFTPMENPVAVAEPVELVPDAEDSPGLSASIFACSSPPPSQEMPQAKESPHDREREHGRGGRGRKKPKTQVTSGSEFESGGSGEGAKSGGSEKEVEADASKVPAVRGDRSGTGGVKKPKLTPAELDQRIVAIRRKNARLTAAHAAASADKTAFLAREAQALETVRVKNIQESKNRAYMDKERERNRARKLKAQERREWDREKEENSSVDEVRGRGYRRGAYGGVVGGVDSNHGYNGEDGLRYAGRGRGSGYGRGRGRGRASYRNNSEVFAKSQGQNEPLEEQKWAHSNMGNSAMHNAKPQEDFPALPPSSSSVKKTAPAVQNANASEADQRAMLPVPAWPAPKSQETWADQVAGEEGNAAAA